MDQAEPSPSPSAAMEIDVVAGQASDAKPADEGPTAVEDAATQLADFSLCGSARAYVLAIDACTRDSVY